MNQLLTSCICLIGLWAALLPQGVLAIESEEQLRSSAKAGWEAIAAELGTVHLSFTRTKSPAPRRNKTDAGPTLYSWQNAYAKVESPGKMDKPFPDDLAIALANGPCRIHWCGGRRPSSCAKGV